MSIKLNFVFKKEIAVGHEWAKYSKYVFSPKNTRFKIYLL